MLVFDLMHLPLIQMGFVFTTLIIALLLYAGERIPIEITSLWVLAILMVFVYIFPVSDSTGTITLHAMDILHGLSNPVVITLFSLMIMGHALSSTGALEKLVTLIFTRSRIAPHTKLIGALCMVVVLSGFLNNIPIVVIFIPIFIALTQKLNVPSAQWMMPLSFVAILGGMTTVMGSSTNILVSGSVESILGTPLDFFAFTEIGVIMAGIGILYVIVFAPRILGTHNTTNNTQKDIERRFFTTITIDATSPLSSKLINGRRTEGCDAYILQLERGDSIITAPFENQAILPHDKIIVQATRETLLSIASKKIENLSPESIPVSPTYEGSNFDSRLLSEVMIPMRSRAVGRTLRTLNLPRTEDIIPIGIERSAGIVQTGFMDTPLQTGDILLLHAPTSVISKLSNHTDFAPIQSTRYNVRHHHHVWHTLLIFTTTIGVSAGGIIPIWLATFLGAVSMITAGCISFKEALKSIDCKAILLIITSLALGNALQATGGASAIANAMVAISGTLPAGIVLSVFFLVVAIMTNILSNQATAILFTPIGISLAHVLGVDANAFIFAVIFASNCCFATPFAYQTNILVMPHGQYNFKDFFRLGTPLALILWGGYSIIAPWYFVL